MKYWPVIGITHAIHMEARADFAAELIRHWGQVAGTTGKEDSAGRAKIDLASPQDVVDRAFEIADCFFAKMEERQDIRLVSLEDVIKAEEGIGKLKLDIETQRYRDEMEAKADIRKSLT